MSAPRLARWLTRMTAPADRLHDMLGDLEEVHLRRRATGAAAAWLTTVFDATVIAAALIGDRMRSATPLDMRHWLSMTDLRLGFRLMWREPIVTLTATAALALGIGLLTVGVATVETMLFSRLPFAGGERFVLVNAMQEPERRPARLSPEEYRLLAAQATALEHLGAASQNRENVTLSSGTVDAATTAGITPTSLAFLPYAPVRGRLLAPSDAAPGAAPVVMIREAFWRRAFGGSDDAIGATIDVGGIARTIVGVAPNAFEFPSRPPDLWTPISEAFLEGRGELGANVRLFGILTPGRSLESAQAQLNVISRRLSPAAGADGPVRLEAVGFTDLGPQARILASAIIVIVMAVLIVVAANVANLVLARSFGRSRELALRAALGASRARLIGQISMEVLLLCSTAALIGGAGAQAALRQFNAMDDMPFWVDFTAGPRTIFMVVGATLLATMIAGAWPAFRATRRDLGAVLQPGDGRASEVRFGRTAGAMVVAQIAVSIVMLHAALIVADGFAVYSGRTLDLPKNVLTTGLRFGTAATPEGTSTPVGAGEIEEIAAGLPGVLAAGLTTALPRHSPPAEFIEIERRAGEAAQTLQRAPSAAVSSGFFGALDATVLAGRLFTAGDDLPGSPPVAIVNVPFVQKFLGGTFPIGRRFRTSGSEPGIWREIVGVVPDLGLSVGDPSLASGYYVPLRADRGSERRFIYLAVRVTGDPVSYVGPLRLALHQRDPKLVLNQPVRLEDVAGEDRAFFMWFSTALIGLGVVTLVLALTGVYAMMALVVTRRTREIGIRIALGATARRVIGTIIGRAAWQVALGAVLGAVLAVLSLDAREMLVSRLGDGGAWTLPTVLVLLVAAGFAATFMPLRRALRVQPSEAMRAE